MPECSFQFIKNGFHAILNPSVHRLVYDSGQRRDRRSPLC
jgi:hypothetical protein